MYKMKLKLASALSVSIIGTCAYAQNQPPVQGASSVQPTSISSVDKNQISKSNGFERDVTPLLREISKKRSQLELRKLDRDLEKIDEESLKAQVQLDALLNASSSTASAAGSQSGGSSNGQIQPNPNGCPSDIQVLMIYGMEGNLMAKVSAGCQGGYVVKKGDVMPDGTVVKNINANFIEVKRDSGAAPDDVVRYFVMPKPAPVLASPMGTNVPQAAMNGMNMGGMQDPSSGAPAPLFPTAR